MVHLAEPTSASLAFWPVKPQGFRSKPDRFGWLAQIQPTFIFKTNS